MEIRVPIDKIRSLPRKASRDSEPFLPIRALGKPVVMSLGAILIVGGCYGFGTMTQTPRQQMVKQEARSTSNSSLNSDEEETGEEEQLDDKISNATTLGIDPQDAALNSKSQDASIPNKGVALSDFSLSGVKKYLSNDQHVFAMLNYDTFEDGHGLENKWDFHKITEAFRAECRSNPEWARVANFNRIQDDLKSSAKTSFYFQIPLRYSSSKIAMLDTWSRYVSCGNIVSPEEMTDKFVRGKVNTRNSSPGFQEYTYIGASFASATGSELMMSAIWFYSGNNFENGFWSPIELTREVQLDNSAALAWGLIAALRGSKRAEEVLAEKIMPKMSTDQISYAVELVIRHAKAQISAVDTHLKHKELMKSSRLNAIPKIQNVDFKRWSKDDVIKVIDNNVAKIDNFFRSGGGERLVKGPAGGLQTCQYSIRDVPGPAALSLPIIERNYRACLAVLEPAIEAMYKEVAKVDDED